MNLTDKQKTAFWAKVAKSDGCWLWTACLGTGGIGMQAVAGRSQAAHRISWAINRGPIPGGHQVYQTCRVRSCVNPDHLATATASDHVAERNRTEKRKLRPLDETFWEKVDKTGGLLHPIHGQCWEWRGALRDTGYGNAWDGKKVVKAHRLSWQRANGDIPSGLHVCHKCDNRLCVRPDHLFVGTVRDNAIDKEAKGRGNHPIGSQVGRSKLAEDQVVEIKKLLDSGEYLQSEIAAMYGISKPMISAINTRRNWTHV